MFPRVARDVQGWPHWILKTAQEYSDIPNYERDFDRGVWDPGLAL